MPEIFLPTAEKQDSIKQTVEGIASNFPLDISGGTDFSKLTTQSFPVSTTEENILLYEITGKGFFHNVINNTGTTITFSIKTGDSIFTFRLENGNLISTLIAFDGLRIKANVDGRPNIKIIYSLS